MFYLSTSNDYFRHYLAISYGAKAVYIDSFIYG